MGLGQYKLQSTKSFLVILLNLHSKDLLFLFGKGEILFYFKSNSINILSGLICFVYFCIMNYEYFIAKRLAKKTGKSFSRPIIIIATISISLGIAVMILSISILQGFKSEIKEKIIGFGSHIQIIPYNLKYSNDPQGMYFSKGEKKMIIGIENVKSIHPFVSKGGVIKTKSDFQGILLKGIDKDYDSNFFHHYLKNGRFINTSIEKNNEAIISKSIADMLGLSLGNKLRVYFYHENNYRARAFNVVGIYETGLADYDEKVVVCGMNQVQSLNDWDENEVEGYEVMLKDFSLIDKTADEIYYTLGQDKTIQTIDEIEPSLFSWLDLLDSNVLVILVIMMLVSIVTITSTLLIIIFEKTNTIGILKGLGATNRSISKIFLYNASYIILRGLIFGNALALSLGFLQYKFQILKPDQDSYFLTSVPIEISVIQIIIVNIITILICIIALLLPARSISKISPIKSIRFD